MQAPYIHHKVESKYETVDLPELATLQFEDFAERYSGQMIEVRDWNLESYIEFGNNISADEVLILFAIHSELHTLTVGMQWDGYCVTIVREHLLGSALDEISDQNLGAENIYENADGFELSYDEREDADGEWDTMRRVLL